MIFLCSDIIMFARGLLTKISINIRLSNFFYEGRMQNPGIPERSSLLVDVFLESNSKVKSDLYSRPIDGCVSLELS